MSALALAVCKYVQFEGIKRRQELFQPCDAVQLLSAKVDVEQVLPVWFKGLGVCNTLNKSVVSNAK